MTDEATLVGSAGVALLLLAFLLNLLKLMRVDGYLYMGLNFAGASLACYSSYLIGFIPFVVLEGVWALVALGAITRSLLRGATPNAPGAVGSIEMRGDPFAQLGRLASTAPCRSAQRRLPRLDSERKSRAITP